MKIFRKKGNDDNRRRLQDTPAATSNVFSYRASRLDSDATTGRGVQSQPKKPSRWLYIPSFIAGIALLISLGYVFTLNTNPKVSVVKNSPALGLRDVNTYQQAAHDILAKSLLSRSKLTIDSNGLSRQLKQQFPELDDIAVTLPLVGHRPIVQLAAVQPSLIIETQNGRYVVASNGKVVASYDAKNSASLEDLPIITDSSGLKLEVGKAALQESDVAFIQVVVRQLKAKQLSIQSITLPAVPNEVDMRLTGQSYFIKFNLAGDARQQAGTYLAAKQKLESDHANPAEYMDLRVEEKVFYK